MPKAIVLIIVTLSLVSCSQLTQNGDPSQTEVQAIGEALAAEIEDAAEGLTLNGAVTLDATGGLSSQASDCLTITVIDASDSDSDTIPREVSFDFNCSGTGWLGGTASLTGQVSFIDPLGAVLGYDATLNDLTLALVNAQGNRSYTETRNGTAIRRFSANSFTETRKVATLRDYKGVFVTALVTITNEWDLSFSPEAGSSIELFKALPSGRFNLTGTTRWSGEDGAYTLEVSTPEGLDYDADCTQTPSIVNGRIDARLSGINNTKISIQFSACGVKPTVTLVSEDANIDVSLENEPEGTLDHIEF